MTTPLFQLFKGGTDLMVAMAPFFISATYNDEAGHTNDTLEVVLADRARELPLPTEDDLLVAFGGYVGGKVAMLGAFKVQGWTGEWEPGNPETMTMQARAATFTGEIKAFGSKHWDDATLGSILQDTAKAAGLTLAIDPELASTEIPYALRWEASPIDFATRLADEHGGIVKAAGKRLAVVKKGSGKGADGAQLPVIRVTRSGSSGWSIEAEPRPRQGDVSASWIDPATGRRELETEKTGKKGPKHSLIHVRASRAEAKAAAKAKAAELNMLTGSGHFIVPFDPANVAGAFVQASGFGRGIDGQWSSESISTTWAKGKATLSTINVKAKPDEEEE
ncbi:contractile injection system protein, VgrG/Pvc8 family [Xanthobacter sp. 126]|uniref:phage late control D family protein n=1 Tax=Xanthobacter sp. 126 TaxID=1131814 RepID=UPI00045E8AA7|nr:contractile injection system protein, VgrG/Pvc8 family [Xanthobacter sp. 126]